MVQKRDARLARAEEIEYRPTEVQDAASRTRKVYALSTIKQQDYILASYDNWRKKYQSSAPALELGQSAPSTDTLIRFAEYLARAGKGHIKKNVSVRSCVSNIECFFAGFKRTTHTDIELNVKKEVTNYIKTQFVSEGKVSTAKKEKHLFSTTEYKRYIHTLWSHPDNYLKHPREVCNNNFLMGNFATLGARIGGLLPKCLDGTHPGIRYKDIQISLERIDSLTWRVIYQLSQRYVKNNKDPENNSYGGVNREHIVPLVDDTQYLIAFALADGAFKGIKTVDQFFNQRIPLGEDHLSLIWEPEVEDLPIVRSIEQNAVTKNPLLACNFERAFKKNLARAGYRETSLVRASVHAIRRALAAEVDSKVSPRADLPQANHVPLEIYTEAQRSQHIGHSDPRVYGEQYVANCSVVDGKSAYFKEAPQSKGIDYFQSFARWYQPGLPISLPVEQKVELRQDPELLALLKHYQELKQCRVSPEELKTAHQKYQTALTRLEREMLQEYQRIWAEQQNLKQICNPTEQSRAQKPDQEMLKILSHTFPERTRLAYALTSIVPVDIQQRKNIIEDLLTAITKDYSVVYLPNETPTDGMCVNPDCKKDMNSLPTKERANHTHKCLRKSLAKKMNRSKREMEYCYLCYHWIACETWNEHCETHLQDNSWSRCGVFEYGDTVLRPAFCPFCIGNQELDASRRMVSWKRDRAMKKHLEAHMSDTEWPKECPVPCCKSETSGRENFLYHLENNHALRVPEVSDPKASEKHIVVHTTHILKRKRKRTVADEEVPCDNPTSSENITSHCDGMLVSIISPKSFVPYMNVDQSTMIAPNNLEGAFIQSENDLQFPVDKSNPMDDNQLSLSSNIPDLPDDNQLFSQFIRTPSPDGEDSANKENAKGAMTEVEDSQYTLEEVQPNKRPRIILRVRPPFEQLKPKNHTDGASQHQKQKKLCKDTPKKSKERGNITKNSKESKTNKTNKKTPIIKLHLRLGAAGKQTQ